MDSINVKGIDNSRIADSVLTLVIPKINELVEANHKLEARIAALEGQQDKPATAKTRK